MKTFWQKITNWECWPFALLYFPISFVWIWYCIRSRSLWFFTASNPTIAFGGFEGEGKKEMYEQLPPHTYPRTIYVQHTDAFENVLSSIQRHGFTYPFIVKPDVGMKGILFRKIENESQLRTYHETMVVEYIIQDMVSLPIELSVFYYRHPASQTGTISGLISKELLHVKGDGKSALSELILQHPRASMRLDEMQRKHGHCFKSVVADGEIYYLSHAGNHNRGARFTNLRHEIDADLLKVFDTLSHYSKHFYYGRYDIKTSSLADLKQGKNIQILEYNGSGAEPNHIYDCNMSLLEAYREILKHWKVLFEISRHNHRNGFPYWSFKKGLAFIRQSNAHFKMLSKYE